MSTHCQLRFQRLNDNPEDPIIAQVYRHSNGEPPLVLDALQRLQVLLRMTHTERRPSYVAAAFMHQETCRMMSVYLDTPWGSSINASTPAAVLDTRSWMGFDQPLFLMEFGIEDPTRGIHGDEEFLYVVELPANAGKQSEAGDWYVRIASLERKRRSAEERVRAFDDARWQFDGPLGEAAERYGIDRRH